MGQHCSTTAKTIQRYTRPHRGGPGKFVHMLNVISRDCPLGNLGCSSEHNSQQSEGSAGKKLVASQNIGTGVTIWSFSLCVLNHIPAN